ncbi:MAG TPA: NDP-sugar synthase [Candidatus Binataceae bacterium]|nr:NDP-sugar synthase [Candidatus Binataceae bacterium]
MKALVLSAGYGERLRPLTARIPKPLVEIAGRPLIHYPLLMLRHGGIREVAVNVHHLAGQIEAALGRGDTLGLSLTYSPEPVLLGTGGPLLALRDYLRGAPFVIVNCDTIMDLDLAAMIRAHREQGALTTMTLRESAAPAAYSQIEIDGSGRIRRMRLLKDRQRGEFDDYPDVLSPGLASELKPYMYCGAMVCESEVLDLMPAAPPFGLMNELLAPMVAQGLPLFGYLHRGFFRTVDDLEGYRGLQAEFASHPPALAYLA